MPETFYRGRSHPYRESQYPRLSQAEELGQFVRVKCAGCKITRHYRPKDIILLCGDCHVFALQGKFRCEKCDDRQSVDVAFIHLFAHEIRGLVVRELTDIKTKRVPIWKDVRL